jgi:peptidoglycan/xylan/chitin deacetylase (PgdA/CDA1 family)
VSTTHQRNPQPPVTPPTRPAVTDPGDRVPVTGPSRHGASHPFNLCFHGIGTPQRELEPGEDEFWLEIDQFDEMLGMIKRHPFINITIDDGNASDVTHALPALLRRGLAATFFIVAERIDAPGALSSEAIRELVASGMRIGSHGLAHRPWRSLRGHRLEAEMRAARIIAEVAQAPVREAACPFGSYDRRVLRALRSHGFTRVYTVDRGRARNGAWLQPRYTVRKDDTAADLERLAYPARGSRTGLRTVIKRLR